MTRICPTIVYLYLISISAVIIEGTEGIWFQMPFGAMIDLLYVAIWYFVGSIYNFA